MHDFYYELRFTPSGETALFAELLPQLIEGSLVQEADTFIAATEEEPQGLHARLEALCAALSGELDHPVTCALEIRKQANADWIETYRQSVAPIDAPPFYVRPPWHPARPERHDIIIEPDLAFGTGHHATTRMCLDAIAKVATPGGQLADIGCGSGILGIAAARLGMRVSLCDTDKTAIMNAQINLSANGVVPEALWEGSVDPARGPYDVVVANIVADVLYALYRPLVAATKPGGFLILSGIMDRYAPKIQQRYRTLQFYETLSDGEWRTIILRNIDAT